MKRVNIDCGSRTGWFYVVRIKMLHCTPSHRGSHPPNLYPCSTLILTSHIVPLISHDIKNVF